MTQYERMVNGLIYDPANDEIMKEQGMFQDLLWAFNQLKPSEYDKKQKYMKEVFAECGDNCYIELPFHANWGGHHVHFGSGIYANSNLTLVDDGNIYIGDKVMFGPNVTIATAGRELSEDWDYAVNKCEFWGQVNAVSASSKQMTLYVADFYDWEAGGMSGLLDVAASILNELHYAGMARDYPVTGSASF